MDTIVAFDWHRLFLGDAPLMFLLEILFRIAVIWLWTMILLRWIGGRSLSQLSLVEFLLVIALGSAVGDSIVYPDVPLLHAMLVILTVVLLDKAVNLAIRRYHTAKTVIDGHPTEVLRDGVVLCSGLRARKLGSLELMELLRLRGVQNLGSVKHVYLEPSGQVSIFPLKTPVLGLPIVPPVESQAVVTKDRPDLCCNNCGTVASFHTECGACGGRTRIAAQMAPVWQ